MGSDPESEPEPESAPSNQDQHFSLNLTQSNQPMSKAHLWTGTPRLSTTSRHHLGSQAEDLSQDCALAYRHASSGRGLKDTDEDHRTFLFLCWSLPGSQSPVLVSLFVPDAPEPEDEDARHTSSVGLLLSAVG